MWFQNGHGCWSLDRGSLAKKTRRIDLTEPLNFSILVEIPFQDFKNETNLSLYIPYKGIRTFLKC